MGTDYLSSEKPGLPNMISLNCFLVILLSAIVVNGSYLSKVPKKTPAQGKHCRAEYETVTSYEQQCSHSYEKECNPVQLHECSPRVEEICRAQTVKECSTSFDEQCTKAHQKDCSISYEQKCDYVPEKSCTTSYEQECIT